MPAADASNPIEAVRARLDDSPTPNVPLLRQTMDAILAHPELHDQSWYATRTECGTAYCFAGWACHLSGLTMDLETLAEEGDTTRLSDGRSIWTVGRDLLGLDGWSASDLFMAYNSTADLKHYVDQIAEHGRIVEPIERGE